MTPDILEIEEQQKTSMKDEKQKKGVEQPIN
jgi:hypothetical protein